MTYEELIEYIKENCDKECQGYGNGDCAKCAARITIEAIKTLLEEKR